MLPTMESFLQSRKINYGTEKCLRRDIFGLFLRLFQNLLWAAPARLLLADFGWQEIKKEAIGMFYPSIGELKPGYGIDSLEATQVADHLILEAAKELSNIAVDQNNDWDATKEPQRRHQGGAEDLKNLLTIYLA